MVQREVMALMGISERREKRASMMVGAVGEGREVSAKHGRERREAIPTM